MNEQEVQKMKKLLKETLEPAQDTELQRDLWPAMLRRLDQRPVRVRLPWWDWALLAAATLALFLVPEIIPTLLYHL